MRRVSGAAPSGVYLMAEGAIAAAAALLFGVAGAVRIATFTTTNDDFSDGFSLFLIGLTLIAAVVLAAYAPVAFFLGRAVRRGSHAAWVAALCVSALQVLLVVLAFPLLVPLALLGSVGLLLLLLPETRSECAPPPVLEDI